MSSDEKYLFTSDRDEKIRISHYPNTYNIHSYLLAHKEFVSQIEFMDENYLLSASGVIYIFLEIIRVNLISKYVCFFDKDSKVIMWNLEEINPVQIINLKDFCNEEFREEDLVGVDRFDFNKKMSTLRVHPFGFIFLY